MLGSATAETNLQTLRLPCYLQLFGVDVGERDCGDESADAVDIPCYLQLLGVDVGERDCGDESADAAVTMLFAAVGGRCWGARLWRRICGRNLRTLLLPCYLQLRVDAAVTMLFAAVGGRC